MKGKIMHSKRGKLKMAGQLLLLASTLLLILTLRVRVLAADTGSCGTSLTWEFSNNTLTISGSGNMYNFPDGEMAPWYEHAEEIRTVILPEELTSIGDLAFYGCTNLTSVVVPDGVTAIGEYAFADCTELLQVHLGNGVREIRTGAFYQCESLSTVSFPESVTMIKAKAFYHCDGLSAVYVPATVTSMGAEVFAYCEGLVRAEVQASMSRLPDWTFYGCSNLVDVSLAPEMSIVGEYAFQHCENLNGIYTSSGSEEVAHKIEQSISKTEGSNVSGFIGAYEMPETSFVARDDGLVYTETKVTQTEEAPIVTKTIMDYSYGNGKKRVIVEATAKDTASWTKVAEATEEAVRSGNAESMEVKVLLHGDTVEASELAQFAGQFITLRIITSSGTIWEVDMSEMKAEYFDGTYNLSASLQRDTDVKNKIASESVYQLKFAGNVDFNVTVGIRFEDAYKLATLYVKEGKDYNLINTMLLDNEDYAWFSLAGVKRKTDYYIGMDVEKITEQEAVIPQSMYQQYDIDEESTLMDANGVRYRITGRSSRWGITLGQFMSYVLVALIAVVLLVGGVMLAFYISKRSREKYERMAEEAALREKEEEEALRLEIVKELLGESRTIDGEKK